VRVLNVGSGGRGSQMPQIYANWDVVWLDLNPTFQPDLLMDARDLGTLEPGQFDAVFSSHCLEHIYPHELRAVIHGMWHVLKADGFVDISVPNIGRLLELVHERGLDLDSHVYDSPGGPICVRDMIWGYSRHQEYTHRPELNLHKNGFSQRTLGQLLINSDFPAAYMVSNDLDLRVIGFKQPPGNERLVALGLVQDDD
jgi:SAM-dependent methyltransferase